MRLLKFEAAWCQPCKQLTQIMDTINFPYPVEKIDIDTNRDACIEYGIRGVPHLILMDENNNIVTRVGGMVTKETLLEVLELT